MTLVSLREVQNFVVFIPRETFWSGGADLMAWEGEREGWWEGMAGREVEREFFHNTSCCTVPGRECSGTPHTARREEGGWISLSCWHRVRFV